VSARPDEVILRLDTVESNHESGIWTALTEAAPAGSSSRWWLSGWRRRREWPSSEAGSRNGFPGRHRRASRLAGTRRERAVPAGICTGTRNRVGPAALHASERPCHSIARGVSHRTRPTCGRRKASELPSAQDASRRTHQDAHSASHLRPSARTTAAWRWRSPARWPRCRPGSPAKAR